ncbi:GNAT family N-acyltransferase [uncultured Jannaschia sp.]|uniref:GNAT family N-acetyltransferase n=1 Tax=uncultured Jannaschia sp. TaxID=293347 RepID=UPI00261A30E3|nr:GNAT family N-acyltransferase [uncultured Jannaschia sp.]
MDVTAGGLRARIVPVDRAGAGLALRARLFRNGACDRDRHDSDARHLLVEEAGTLCGYARLAVQRNGAAIGGYAGTRYDLGAFACAFPVAIEVGRFCIAPGHEDPRIPRLMLATMARAVTAEGATALHGCASFPLRGNGPVAIADRVAPEAWRSRRRAAETMPLAALAGPMPPLLRMWLALGASISDHAVIDRDLGTLHVHAALPVAAIPLNRARRLAKLLAA